MGRISTLLFAMWFVSALSPAQGQLPVSFGPPPPKGIPWGPYYVESGRLEDTDDGVQQWHVGVLTRDGRLVREVQGYSHAQALQVQVGAGKPPILLVSVGDGAGDGGDLVYAYIIGYQHRVRNLFATPGMSDDFTFTHLDNGYVPALQVTDHSALNEFDHFTRGCLGPIFHIYQWNFDKYVDATRYFPQPSIRAADQAKTEFLRNLKREEAYVRGNDSESGREDVMAPAIEYWANELAAGRGDEADAFFRKNCSRNMREWLERRRSMVARAVRQPLPTNNSPRVLM